MKRSQLLFVLSSNIVFILLLLHNKHLVRELHQTHKKTRKELYHLAHHKTSLERELDRLHNTNSIAQFAQQYLNLTPIAKHQVRFLSEEHEKLYVFQKLDRL